MRGSEVGALRHPRRWSPLQQPAHPQSRDLVLQLPLHEELRSFRVPVVGIDKRFVAKAVTYRDIQEIIAWSFRMLAIGQNPTRRHDGTPWLTTDGLKAFAGKAMPARGMLAELRAD